jgi:hypothetical protein
MNTHFYPNSAIVVKSNIDFKNWLFLKTNALIIVKSTVFLGEKISLINVN